MTAPVQGALGLVGLAGVTVFAVDPNNLATTVSGVVVAAFGLAAGYLSSRNSKQAAVKATTAVAEVDQRKVDQETFDRVTRELRTSLNDERAERQWLEQWCYSLEKACYDAHIPVPPRPPRPPNSPTT